MCARTEAHVGQRGEESRKLACMVLMDKGNIERSIYIWEQILEKRSARRSIRDAMNIQKSVTRSGVLRSRDFRSTRSTKLQQEFLKARGFSVKADLAGEETAFIAEWGSGKPILAFLGEFDALSSLQQEADCTERHPIEGKTNGHGCGHHLLGTASVAAVDALKTYMEENHMSGTTVTMAVRRRKAGGKAYLVRDGYFDDCDIAITWHPYTMNKVMKGGFHLANFRAFFTFHGTSSHAAGRRSLDVPRWMPLRSWISV